MITKFIVVKFPALACLTVQTQFRFYHTGENHQQREKYKIKYCTQHMHQVESYSTHAERLHQEVHLVNSEHDTSLAYIKTVPSLICWAVF